MWYLISFVEYLDATEMSMKCFNLKTMHLNLRIYIEFTLNLLLCKNKKAIFFLQLFKDFVQFRYIVMSTKKVVFLLAHFCLLVS